MDKVLLRLRGMLCFDQEQTEESTKEGNQGIGLAVSGSIMSEIDRGDVAVGCISA